MTRPINSVLPILRKAGNKKNIEPTEVQAVARYFTPNTCCFWIIGLLKTTDVEKVLGVQSRGIQEPSIAWMDVQTDDWDIRTIDGLPVTMDQYFTATTTLGRYAEIVIEQHHHRKHAESERVY